MSPEGIGSDHDESGSLTLVQIPINTPITYTFKIIADYNVANVNSCNIYTTDEIIHSDNKLKDNCVIYLLQNNKNIHYFERWLSWFREKE